MLIDFEARRELCQSWHLIHLKHIWRNWAYHLQCVISEADREIAMLANTLYCPVWFNDSAFFFPLKKTVKKTITIYFYARRYHVDNWAQFCPSLGKEFHKLLASFLGNTVITSTKTWLNRSMIQSSQINEKHSLGIHLIRIELSSLFSGYKVWNHIVMA